MLLLCIFCGWANLRSDVRTDVCTDVRTVVPAAISIRVDEQVLTIRCFDVGRLDWTI